MDSMWCVKEESKVHSRILARAGGRRETPLTEIVRRAGATGFFLFVCFLEDQQHGFVYSEFVLGGQRPRGRVVQNWVQESRAQGT